MMAEISASHSNDGPTESSMYQFGDSKFSHKMNREERPDINQNVSIYHDAEESELSSSDLDLSERLRQSENEKIAVIVDHNNMVRNYNDRMEAYLHEIRVLNELNKGLKNDLNELRDLCCYLDDDRKNCRRIAKEWQRFGRYTVTVMRDEVLSYSEKLSQLEAKQSDLMKENAELRDLCLYLDNKRKADISSDNDEDRKMFNFVICSECKSLKKEDNKEASPLSAEVNNGNKRLTDESDSVSYTNKLESRIKQLEEERDFFITTFASKKDRKEKKRVSFSVPEDDCDSSSLSEQDRGETPMFLSNLAYRDGQHGILRNGFLSPPPKMESLKHHGSTNNRPCTISKAMQVLEIQDRLDRGSTSSSEEPMTEEEVTILRQMCNAAWSKLGDNHSIPLPSSPSLFDSDAKATVNSHSEADVYGEISEHQALQATC